uniref:TNFR-Cys domain-containing protein n=1 Tax=Schizaphis graminum TaxID=13262 RepID=A0A2S2PNS3_SCHGA
MSYAFVSVFALAILLNVFYFDSTQSLDTIDIYWTCKDCIGSQCHKEGHNCAPTANGKFVCFSCQSTTNDGDQQFYSESHCKSSCSDPSKCTCDGTCWVCVIKGHAGGMICDNLGYVLDDNCKESPYNPQ